jgi:hypothetical protein
MRRFVFIIALLFCLSVPAMAAKGDVTIDPDKLSPAGVQQLYMLKKMTEGSQVPTVDQMEKWATMGQGIAKAIGATCKELNVEVNAFVQTPVGKLTVFMIVYKVIGAVILKSIVATVAWIVIMILSWSAYNRLFGTERVEKDGVITYVPKYRFHTSDARVGAAVFNVAIPVAFTLLWVIIV